jgi:phosphoribosylaminoimidazole-succinocarboxamide synthase
VGTAEEDETNTGADELAEEDETNTGADELAEEAAIDDELGTLLLDTMLEVPEETTMELLAADEATGVDETRIDDEGMASQFPKPGWHPVPQ